MHPSRRRKKRPNYGIRTVEVMRGPNGFGFTISGQQPCILSCIVSNSPADQAGLRAGDFLISVNGVSVSKITHDAVVNLIGNSVGPIRMTIAENYYSDSSDEDLDMNRMVHSRKPKYMHKPRGHRSHKSEVKSTVGDNLNKRVVKSRDISARNDLRGDHSRFGEETLSNSVQNVSVLNNIPMEDDGAPIEYKVLVGYLGTIEMPKQLHPNSRLQTVCSCIRKLRQEKRTPTSVVMTILPTCLTLKNASNHILAIYPTNRVVYVSCTTDKESRYFGLVTSAVCDSRGAESLQQRYDGSATNIWHLNNEKKCNLDDKSDIEVSNSCHVFVTDSKIIDHNTHLKKAESFNICCSNDVVTGNCMEFPKNALPIVSLIQNMYRLQDPFENRHNNPEGQKIDENPVIANSPQPSASSNSDSGIGFRDDCGNISDRILVVEFPSPRPLPVLNPNNKRPAAIDASKIPLETLDMPLNNSAPQDYTLNNVRCMTSDFKCSVANNMRDKHIDKQSNNLNNIRAYENITIKNAIEKNESFNKNLDKCDFLAKQNNDQEMQNNTEPVKRLTVRAMPDPASRKSSVHVPLAENVYAERAVDVPEDSPSKKSCESISLHSVNDDFSDFKSSVDNISVHSSKSFELSNLKSVFKTPSTKYLEGKKHTKRQLMMISSCDNLVSSKYEESVLNYKLSPKVYGVSKPNHSCEELNNLDAIEMCGYGSLQDLCSWNEKYNPRRNIAQSEPDVRVQGNGKRGLICEKDGVPKSSNSEGPAGWATSFEKLLEDPLGLHTFAEFLKKEFSAENIYFWTACERYRKLPPGAERVAEAQRIYRQHLCVGAPEPVNVDCQGRQCTEQSLPQADQTLFDQAQKQIFNLMKFDSYPRFLKSDLYKQCLSGKIDGPRLDAGLLLQPQATSPSKLKKSLSNAEDRRRKSLLPWHRKNRSKSKDRGESEYNERRVEVSQDEDTHSVNNQNGVNELYSSKSSLTSLDLAMTSSLQESIRGSQDELSLSGRGPLCRVILNNGSTTIVQIKSEETIHHFISRLLEKRGLFYSAFEVHTDKHHKSLDVNEPCTKLAGCEVTIEQRVVFKLDLPNRKIIAVKSKYTKILMSVLKPILNKYNYSLDQVKVTIDNEIVDVSLPVTAVDGKRLNIQLIDGQNDVPTLKINSIKSSNTLDEITNKVYEDILHEKSETVICKPKSDRGSVKSEDWGSEHSSGIFGRFLRRDSAVQDRKKKGIVRRGNSNHSSREDIRGDQGNVICKKPLIAKLKAGVKLQVACSESDELYEGLSRAQRSRLEDQRGTEINFELPDFLKDKENEQKVNFLKPHRRSGEHSASESSKFYISDAHVHPKHERSTSVGGLPKNPKLDNYENTSVLHNDFGGPRVVVNNFRIYSPNKSSSDDNSKSNGSSPSKCGSLDNTVIENDFAGSNNNKDSQNFPRQSIEPPPLPPKPKILPIRPSNWGQNPFFKQHKDAAPSDRNKQMLYLEQPTSSFV